MKGIFIACCTVILLNTALYAQPTPDRVEQSTSSRRSYKKTYDLHMFFGYTFYARGVNSDSINYFKPGSTGISMGFAYEKFLGKFLALGVEVVPLSYNWYSFQKDASFKAPDTLLHSKEKYRGNVGQFGAYIRIQSPRYDEIAALHLDIGANLSIPYYYRYVTVDHPSQYKVKQITSGLDTQIYYSVFARLGFSAFDLYASYRLTDIFPEKSPYPQPPKINVGIQIELPDFNPSY